MRRMFTSGAAVLALFLSVAPAAAQTVMEIVARNLDAKGGVDRLKSVSSLKLTGTMRSQGRELPITIYMKRPNMVRQETIVEGRHFVQAFDGELAWAMSPMTGERPVALPPAQSTLMRDQADFDGPLLDSARKGIDITYVGEEEVAGRRAFLLRIRKRSGPEQRLYLDAETALEMRSVVEVAEGGERLRIENIMGDYREVDGIRMPHRLETIVNGEVQAQVSLESIEVSPQLADEVFQMPAGR